MSPIDNCVTRDVTQPDGIVQVYRNFWWWCVDGDPRKALFYCPRGRRDVGSPQCNQSEAVAKRIGEDLHYVECAQMVQIPLAFVPWED